MTKRTKKEEITIDDVRSEMLALFHRLIRRLERLTNDCEDPSTINQAIKSLTDFLIKLNKAGIRTWSSLAVIFLPACN